MKHWPVPNSYSKIIPAAGPGSFLEDRGDRRHCGVDIYAPEGSDVFSIEEGKVIDIGIFTSPDKVSYWNHTRYVSVENKTGLICRYAELGDVTVMVGESVKAGQLIGHIGLVLDADKVTRDSPPYIQKIKKKENLSMLHFELYKSFPTETNEYLGGNWFGDTKPKNLLDPSDYLRATLEPLEKLYVSGSQM
jgi:murein DD-endopeptidase MepM/ murein hydrolase activator NlpD